MSVDPLQLGREAIRRYAWPEAMEAFAEADRTVGLSAEDLELQGEAAWWTGQPDDASEVLERAFARYLETERPIAAAKVALLLTYFAFRRGTASVGAGWLARAERLLESAPESATHAWVEVVHTVMALMQIQIDEAIGHADRAIELGRIHGDPDAHGIALSFKGIGEIARGRWQEGLALVDEAAAAATSGQIGVRTASDIYCNTIAACRDLGDFGRAGQWTDEAERWMHSRSAGGYPGVCRVHRAELKMLRGLWPEAEQEARHACGELEQYRLMDSVGFAHYEVGEVRLRMGDLTAAAEAFDRAYEFGHDPQPGLALLQLALGDTDEAARSISHALDAMVAVNGAPAVVWRARLLPAQVTIALARADMPTAESAVLELESIASNLGRPAFEAAALSARGEVLVHAGDPSTAVPLLRRSWRLWQEIDLPYESARARELYGNALMASGDRAAGEKDLRAARGTFERLGAALDLRRVEEVLGEDRSGLASKSPQQVRTLMFTDIVTSSDLVGLIGDEAWEKLLRWHDRELRTSFARHRGEEAKHTGDGFFVTFERAVDGVDCAVDIQRRLARHREEHGFAPLVRIGVHVAPAMRQGGDWSGQGVHTAARIGAAADRDEILVSSAVLEATGPTRFPLSEPRVLKLKGISEPVEARLVEWR